MESGNRIYNTYVFKKKNAVKRVIEHNGIYQEWNKFVFFKQEARGVFWGQILNTRERDKETMVSGTAVIPERDGGGEHRM